MLAVIYFITMNTNCQVFGHLTAFYRFNTNGFKCMTKIY